MLEVFGSLSTSTLLFACALPLAGCAGGELSPTQENVGTESSALSYDPTTWKYFTTNDPGYPKILRKEVILIPDNRYQSAAVAFSSDYFSPPYSVDFEYLMLDDDGGSIWNSADGVVLMLNKDDRPYVGGVAPPTGAARGFINDGTGYGVHFATYGARSVFLQDGSGAVLAQTANYGTYTHGKWAKVHVEAAPEGIKVLLDGVSQINWSGNFIETGWSVGIGAATGAADSEHRIRGVEITPGAPPGGDIEVCAQYKGTGCYWMENTSGNYCWVPAGWAESFSECYAMDSCDGGLGHSGGGCYKWADSSDGARYPW